MRGTRMQPGRCLEIITTLTPLVWHTSDDLDTGYTSASPCWLGRNTAVLWNLWTWIPVPVGVWFLSESGNVLVGREQMEGNMLRFCEYWQHRLITGSLVSRDCEKHLAPSKRLGWGVNVSTTVMEGHTHTHTHYPEYCGKNVWDPLDQITPQHASKSFIPNIIWSKLKQMSITPFIIKWYHSLVPFSTLGCIQHVKLSTLFLNLKSGAAMGCVIARILFTLYTNEWMSRHPHNIIIKFTDDTAILSLLYKDSGKSNDQPEVIKCTQWGDETASD